MQLYKTNINRELETKLQMAGAGVNDSIPIKQNVKCLVVGDSLVRNVGTDHSDMKV